MRIIATDAHVWIIKVMQTPNSSHRRSKTQLSKRRGGAADFCIVGIHIKYIEEIVLWVDESETSKLRAFL